MTEWTRIFLDKEFGKVGSSFHNALNALEELKIPFELWEELSHEILGSNCLSSMRRCKKLSIEDHMASIFMAGMAVGWMEKTGDLSKAKKENEIGEAISR